MGKLTGFTVLLQGFQWSGHWCPGDLQIYTRAQKWSVPNISIWDLEHSDRGFRLMDSCHVKVVRFLSVRNSDLNLPRTGVSLKEEDRDAKAVSGAS